jgi:hypothetical protein
MPNRINVFAERWTEPLEVRACTAGRFQFDPMEEKPVFVSGD